MMLCQLLLFHSIYFWRQWYLRNLVCYKSKADHVAPLTKEKLSEKTIHKRRGMWNAAYHSIRNTKKKYKWKTERRFQKEVKKRKRNIMIKRRKNNYWKTINYDCFFESFANRVKTNNITYLRLLFFPIKLEKKVKIEFYSHFSIV